MARGEVDAGFVYTRDVRALGDRVRQGFAAPLKTPITYPLALIKDRANAADAKRFVAFIRPP